MNDQSGRIEKLLTLAKEETEEKTSVSAAEREFSDSAEAERVYQKLRAKLFLIERWNSESGAMSFALFGDDGKEILSRCASVGDFICITLPGTGKNDWVAITDIFEIPAETILSVQPTFDPTDKSADQSDTSHFFTDESTNNFCLRLDDKKIMMYVIGLNEVTNTGKAGGIIESVRNLATANLGHYLGFQKAAWTTFCSNFLEDKKRENE